jgi:uncharacterized membrane protein YtjA (UPF0391 family)
MSRWTIILLPLGLLVALLGLGALAIVTAGIVKTLILCFVTAFVASLMTLALAMRTQERHRPPEGRPSTTDGTLGAGTRPLSD